MYVCILFLPFKNATRRINHTHSSTHQLHCREGGAWCTVEYYGRTILRDRAPAAEVPMTVLCWGLEASGPVGSISPDSSNSCTHAVSHNNEKKQISWLKRSKIFSDSQTFLKYSMALASPTFTGTCIMAQRRSVLMYIHSSTQRKKIIRTTGFQPSCSPAVVISGLRCLGSSCTNRSKW